MFRTGDAARGRSALPGLLATAATHGHLRTLARALPADAGLLAALAAYAGPGGSRSFARRTLEAVRRRGCPARRWCGRSFRPRPRRPSPPRELEVLHQLALGGSYADIAGALFVTENTVKTHLASVYRKLGVTRRAHALRVGRERGLLGVPYQPASADAPVVTGAD
ncbi:helix-turn-helix transcriptional regulator [Nocardioides sp. TF02-7]|uniref:helix-turn-helix transcriptional regulator n=1 Tax=Nocardioides sp. TF02-7 TaxID=2917724 RepID=UPI001F05A1AB|nr:helix-turn-helix transcriptional regulator [Nocardioides sp. TF02-7]UMG94839.1 helix-turn-helix transcriptional regulator [Nocardioides sp. TF02-7]